MQAQPQTRKARMQRFADAAARVQPKACRTFAIPNTPYGVPKIQPKPKMVLPDLTKRDWLLVASAGFDDFNKFPIKAIIKATAQHFNVAVSDIISQRRTADIVRPRQVAMYLAKVMTLRSLPEIGGRFGGRDHTTALHAVRKIERLIPGDEKLADDVATIRAAIEREVMR